MNILIAPDKFKGTLTAAEVCEAIERGLIRSGIKANIRKLPLADGGEGTLEIFLHHKNGRLVAVEVHDPLMRKIKASYALSHDGKTAFIEMARASGLGLVSPEEQNPLRTTTFGTGELMRDAFAKGATHVLLGIGGSSTNDAALGALVALGANVTDDKGNLIFPVGEALGKIASIELNNIGNLLKGKTITAICDVSNPFYGEQGAARVYAPQKGAGSEAVEILDKGLRNLAALIGSKYAIDLQTIPGAGAGGGFAGGVYAFLGARLKRGVEVVFDMTGFKDAAAWSDVIITGEGKLDAQTLNGKVVQGVVDEANRLKKPVWVVCGQNLLGHPERARLSVTNVLSLTDWADLASALANPAAVLEDLTFKSIATALKSSI